MCSAGREASVKGEGQRSRMAVRRVLMALLAVGSFLLSVPAPASEGIEEIKCTLVADAATGMVLHRSGTCDRRFSPCSSFKLALALMGFDSGILESPKAPVWELKPEYNPSRRDLEYKQVYPELWERESVVWFSQQLTMRLGEKRLSEYVRKFSYGNQDISGDPGRGNGLTQSWLMSSLTISPEEQIHFLLRFVARTLPVSRHAHDMTLATIPRYPAAGGWTVHGKSGSGWLRDGEGKVNESRPQGWFVGWAERDGRQVVFARLEVRAEKSDIFGGTKAREEMLVELPALVGDQ